MNNFVVKYLRCPTNTYTNHIMVKQS
uniref:Uncharacterized protein n=1 Tax=Arundo donax TaxID=35708 RepID=A0A0A9A398_ARUDO